MKRIFFAACSVMFLLMLTPVFSQDDSSATDDRKVYTKTFLVGKIWSHRLGYRVDYFSTKMDIVSLYIPMELFTGSNGKARLVYGQGAEYPYLSIIWIDGKLDHLTIYAVEHMGALSWGVLHGGDELASKFQPEIKITF